MNWTVLLCYLVGMFVVGLPVGILSLKALKYKERKILRYLMFPIHTLIDADMPKNSMGLVWMSGITHLSLHSEEDDAQEKLRGYIAYTMLIWPLRLLWNAICSVITIVTIAIGVLVSLFDGCVNGVGMLLKQCKRCIKI